MECCTGPNHPVRDVPNCTDGEPRRFRHAKRHMPVPGEKKRERERNRERGREEEKEGGESIGGAAGGSLEGSHGRRTAERAPAAPRGEQERSAPVSQSFFKKIFSK